MDEITRTETRFQWKKNLWLFLIALAIKLLSMDHALVEKYYSTGIYPYIAKILRAVTHYIPFSIGDLLYAFWVILLLLFIVDLLKAIFRKRKERPYWWLKTAKHVTTILWVYIWFNVLWGLNYDRLGIMHQLGLKEERYGKAAVDSLTSELIEKVNAARKEMGDENYTYPSRSTIYSITADAYNDMGRDSAFFQYPNTSIKRSLYGKMGNKLGFLGYYNPFTGEAQINVKIPEMMLPFVVCHEVAHQLGYAYENEANFVGYLAAMNTKDPVFRYSAYFDMFNYANSELFSYDSVQARANVKLLDTLVRKDLRILREYYKEQKNPFEPVIRMLYGQFLKMNNQPKGINTYNEVVGALLAYRRKYGRI